MNQVDFNDLVFDRRNKLYGAYFLRKHYNQVINISLFIAVITGSTMVIIPFLITPKDIELEVRTVSYVIMDNLKPPGPDAMSSLPPPLSSPPPGSPSRIKNEVIAYVAPKVVDSILIVEKPLALTSDSTGTESVGDGVNNGIGDGTGNYSGGIEGGIGGGGGNGTYARVDEMPTFKGGDINKFREWVQKRTKYPLEATANGIQGKVYITFVIESDGTISTVKVARGVDPLIDNEALKAVASSPKWSPGKLRGKVVRVSYYITVNFEL
jgi:protein TonB